MTVLVKRRLTVCIAALPLLAMCTAACAALTAASVERIIRGRIAEKWTTKDLKVRVVPYTSAARTRKGQFAQIKISAASAVRKGKHIKVVGLAITAKGVQIDTRKLAKNDFDILSRKSGTLRAKFYEADINKLLARKKSSIDGLRADFGDGVITFMGKYGLNIKLTGTIDIKKGYELHFRPTRASIGILGVPLGIVNKFLAKLNPIIDMREVPLKPKLKSLKITPKYISVSG